MADWILDKTKNLPPPGTPARQLVAKIHLSAAPIDNFFAGLQGNARVLHGKGMARWLKV